MIIIILNPRSTILSLRSHCAAIRAMGNAAMSGSEALYTRGESIKAAEIPSIIQ